MGTSNLIYKCKEMLQANPGKTLGLAMVFFTEMPPHGLQNARQCDICDISID